MSISSVPGQGLLKTKQNEDPGFEIIKEVQGSGKPYSSMYNNPSLSALATLMGTGAGPHSGLGGAGGLLNQNFLQKSLENGSMNSGMLNPFLMGNMGGMSGMNAFSGLPGMGIPQMNASMLSNLYMQGGVPRFQGRMMDQLGYPSLTRPSASKGEQEDEEVAAEDEEDMGVIETYSNYKPTKLNVGLDHPDPVVETASLASVEPADVWYTMSIPEECIQNRKLSALQLESIVYASQQHEQFLPDGTRAGFLIGDGAGVGKGRTIAGVIWENYLKGRKRAIWVSVSNDLKYDAERDLSDIGCEGLDVHFLSKMKYAKINSQINGNIRKGIVFATYSALIGESQGGGKYKSRLKQLLHWCGDDFDGCIVFDECHKAKNLCPTG
ncbi:protein strawberry notch homolog 1 isoform X2 [Eurytemora carolleeae]|uniref:protein strawberry notch homolog 1 isoform X2 n=1 Tax=Eurytemora carolleeae TaxID=1294199 RepID=UPI000C76A264|nr:protein strawberry notch homolog 1 isoform X2 [Eurytemora carolleeae]|eukprot:XP_023339743.1 protein strawberry notch homolog 1-like isoform X2 [Eurytemora affinis]